jgi:hypothetical protein
MAIEELTSITSKDRILLYLSDFSHMEERYELPQELTQEHIAYCTGVQRKHLSQYLDDLIKEGLLTERKAHIHAMKQRMNGYYLSSSGYSKTATLRNHLGQVVVPVRINGRMKEMKVSEVDEMTSIHVTYCDIVREAIQIGSLDMVNLAGVEARKRDALEKSEQSSETYKRALQTVWRDGRVTASERFLLEELRKHLKIALADGVLSGPEVEILENLRRVFRISRQEHEELMNEVQTAICGPSGFDNLNLADHA